MNTYTMFRTYVEGLLLPLVEPDDEPRPESFADDRGATIGEYIVITLASLTGAAVVGGIIWLALKNGADTVNVEAPPAP